jgi:hypothetical protein
MARDDEAQTSNKAAMRAQMDRLRELAKQAPRGRARGKVKVTLSITELEDLAQLIRAGLLLARTIAASVPDSKER